jgi:hypothetical protein
VGITDDELLAHAGDVYHERLRNNKVKRDYWIDLACERVPLDAAASPSPVATEGVPKSALSQALNGSRSATVFRFGGEEPASSHRQLYVSH